MKQEDDVVGVGPAQEAAIPDEGIANPIAVKVGPLADAAYLKELTRRLNPDNVPGRLTLIHRLGAKEVTIHIRTAEEYIPVTKEEIFEAKREGVRIKGLRTPAGLVLDAGGRPIGGPRLAVIGGPCSVGSRARIVEAARRAGAERLVSEDFSPGQRIAGLTIMNPFEPAQR